jgi:hypothetical protein
MERRVSFDPRNNLLPSGVYLIIHLKCGINSLGSAIAEKDINHLEVLAPKP